MTKRRHSATFRALAPVLLFALTIIGLCATHAHVDRRDAADRAHVTTTTTHADRAPLAHVFGR